MAELEELIYWEEIMWKQRSLVAWLQEGDKNTPFFHSRASQRRQRNIITWVQDSLGTWITDPASLLQLFTAYYQGRFTSAGSVVSASFIDLITPRVSPRMILALDSAYTPGEVSKALKSMHPSKAPGPDGMPPLFYKMLWSFLELDVSRAILSILNDGEDPSYLNHTHITLIPKVKHPNNCSQFCSISLYNVIVKMVTKMIAERLKSILPQIISENQSAFVPGRLITDNALIA